MKLSLQIQILIGLILGIICGIFFGELCTPLERLGLAFIMLLKMPILLFMSFSLIYAIGNQSKKQAFKILKYGSASLVMIWIVTISMIFLGSIAYPEYSETLAIGDPLISSSNHSSDLLSLFIPLNPIHAISNEIVPAIVLFSLLFGIILIPMKNKSDFLKNLKVVISVLEGITSWVSKYSPIGVFALIASSVGTISFEKFGQIQLYVFTLILVSLALSFWALPILVASFTSISKRRFLNELRPAILLSFSTGNLLIALPLLGKCVENLIKKEKIHDEESRGCIDSLIPIAYNFPTSGNLLIFLFILFTGYFFGINLSGEDHAYMITIGLPSLFGPNTVLLNSVVFLCDTLHLPIDSIALFFETMPLTRNFHILVSCVQVAALVVLVIYALKKRIKINLRKSLPNIIALVVVFSLIGLGIRNLGENERKAEKFFKNLNITEKVNHKYLEEPSYKRNLNISVLQQIQESKTLVVGYNAALPPYSYLNQSKNLVGFDIAMAHKLAKDLNVSIEFVPFSFKNLERDLQKKRFDIAMSAISITENRIKTINFSKGYLKTPRVLVTQDYRRKEVKNYLQLKNKSDFRLAVLEGSSHEELAKKYFPKSSLIRISDYQQFLVPNLADALFWSQAEAMNWTVKYPSYTSVVTEPSIGIEAFSYAISQNEPDWQQYLNQWIDLKELEGFLEKEYDYWVLGKLPHKEKRWSIIKDILKWVE